MFEMEDPQAKKWIPLTAEQILSLGIAFPHFRRWVLTNPASGAIMVVGLMKVRKV